MTYLLAKCTTTKTIKIKKHIKIKPWITNAMMTSIEYRDNLKKNLVKNRNNLNLAKTYKTYRNNF